VATPGYPARYDGMLIAGAEATVFPRVPQNATSRSLLQTTPSPRLRDSRLQRAVDEVVASIVGTRAFVGGPGVGRPRVEDCADEHRQEQRTCTKQ
jgi:hypothetical protein